jgi:putative DNA primase/helicase
MAADILSRLADHGIRPHRSRLQPGAPGEHRAPCPECARPKKAKDDALAVRIGHDGGATWTCHRCGWKGGIGGERDLSRRRDNSVGAYRNPEPEPEKHETLARWGLRLWEHTRPIVPGTVAAAYLEARGCALPTYTEETHLRWHPKLKHPSGHVGPALVALVTTILDCAPISLHRTWLKADGTGKADLDKPRLLLAGHRSDGVVRLWPDEDVHLGLVLGEGIETCLAAERAGYTPSWAALSGGTLAAFPVLPGLEGITILADHDEPNPKTGKRAGIEAARAVIERYVAAGSDPERDLRVVLPPTEGEDAADLERPA